MFTKVYISGSFFINSDLERVVKNYYIINGFFPTYG